MHLLLNVDQLLTATVASLSCLAILVNSRPQIQATIREGSEDEDGEVPTISSNAVRNDIRGQLAGVSRELKLSHQVSAAADMCVV